jgi:hypothetical protein
MVISAETLFHFTTKAEHLINILTNEFRPRFCFEDKELLLPELPESENYAIPMVCFCDLPLSSVKEHLQFYGNYGIGLSKEWGIRKGINPILYFVPDSIFITHFRTLILHTIVQNRNTDNKVDVDLVDYTKPYKGTMYRKGKKIKNKNFYDEKEWRYIPYLRLIENPQRPDYRLRKSDFDNPTRLAQANNDLSEAIKLSFTPDDIKYIIVEKEKEILPMIDAIKKIKGKYSEDTVNKLLTRIISSEQIKSDF